MCSGVDQVRILRGPSHATSPKLYRSYYPHRSRELVSPVCGIFCSTSSTTRPRENNSLFIPASSNAMCRIHLTPLIVCLPNYLPCETLKRGRGSSFAPLGAVPGRDNGVCPEVIQHHSKAGTNHRGDRE